MSIRCALFTILAVAGCGGSKKSAPAPAAPAAPPAATAEAPAPAPTPSPAPAPAAAPDPKQNILAIVDKIDAELKACEDKKMEHVEDNARTISQLVDELAGPIGEFPRASATFAKLKEHAPKFEASAKKGQHKDLRHHYEDMTAATKAIRTQL